MISESENRAGEESVLERGGRGHQFFRAFEQPGGESSQPASSHHGQRPGDDDRRRDRGAQDNRQGCRGGVTRLEPAAAGGLESSKGQEIRVWQGAVER